MINIYFAILRGKVWNLKRTQEEQLRLSSMVIGMAEMATNGGSGSVGITKLLQL